MLDAQGAASWFELVPTFTDSPGGYVQIALRLRGPQVYRNSVYANSTIYFSALFNDENYARVEDGVLTSITWKFVDLNTRQVLSQGTIAPAGEVSFSIPAAANVMKTMSDSEPRALTITAMSGASVARAEYEFRVRRLQ